MYVNATESASQRTELEVQGVNGSKSSDGKVQRGESIRERERERAPGESS